MQKNTWIFSTSEFTNRKKKMGRDGIDGSTHRPKSPTGWTADGRNEHPLYMMVPLVPLRLSTL